MFVNEKRWCHWQKDRNSDMVLDFGYEKNLTDLALAEALGIEGEYDESAMQLVFMELPEDKPSIKFAQTQLLEAYINKHPAQQTLYDIWWEARYGIGKKSVAV